MVKKTKLEELLDEVDELCRKVGKESWGETSQRFLRINPLRRAVRRQLAKNLTNKEAK